MWCRDTGQGAATGAAGLPLHDMARELVRQRRLLLLAGVLLLLNDPSPYHLNEPVLPGAEWRVSPFPRNQVLFEPPLIAPQ